MQKYYAMKCLNCGFEYKSNGSDIWQRKVKVLSLNIAVI